MMSSLFSCSLQQHMEGRQQWDDTKCSSTRPPSYGLWHTHAPTHAETFGCHVAFNLFKMEIVSVASVTVPAVFVAVHTPARFATVQINFEVVHARYGLSQRLNRQTLLEMLIRCVLGGMYPLLGLRDTHRVLRCPSPWRFGPL